MPEPFEAVLQECLRLVIAGGGATLRDTCRAREFYDLAKTKDGEPLNPAYDCNCGNQTRAAIRYLNERDRPSEAKVCLVCDALYLTPNYEVRVNA